MREVVLDLLDGQRLHDDGLTQQDLNRLGQVLTTAAADDGGNETMLKAIVVDGFHTGRP